MTQTESPLDDERIKRYVFGELSPVEREELEEEFFENDDLYVETAEMENRLVDLYVSGKLVGSDLIRFEASLRSNPSRATKIANAKVLRDFIAEEKTSIVRVKTEATAPEEAQSFFQKIASALRLGNPAVGFSMAALLIVLSVAAFILFNENRRKADEIARLREASGSELLSRQKELEEQLAKASERAEQIQRESEIQSAEGDRVYGELQSITQEKERIQAELEKLRREKKQTPSPEKSTGPTIATFILAPTFSARGGGVSGGSRNLSIPAGSQTVSLRLALPEEVKPDEVLKVVLNGSTIKEKVPARKSVQVDIASRQLNDGLNRLSLEKQDGVEAARYIFNVNRK